MLQTFSRTICATLEEGSMRTVLVKSFKFRTVVQEEMSFKVYILTRALVALLFCEVKPLVEYY